MKALYFTLSGLLHADHTNQNRWILETFTVGLPACKGHICSYPRWQSFEDWCFLQSGLFTSVTLTFKYGNLIVRENLVNRDINKNRWERTDCHLSTTVSWKQFLKVYIRLEFGQMMDHICVRGRKAKLKENKTCQSKGVSAWVRFHFSFSEILWRYSLSWCSIYFCICVP